MGEGITSSSDGQRFQSGGRGEEAGQVNIRYGTEPGVLFYTRIGPVRAIPHQGYQCDRDPGHLAVIDDVDVKAARGGVSVISKNNPAGESRSEEKAEQLKLAKL